MYRTIGVEELGRRLEAGEDLKIVDLRDEESYAAGHLPGARCVPSGVRVERWIPQRFPTASRVVLYDDGGDDRRAAHEAAHLSHLWYQGLAVLKGGFAAWRDSGRPVEEGAPADPLGGGRHIETRRPAAGIIPEVYDPRRSGAR